MKVLMVINSLKAGGAEKLLFWMVPKLKKQGVDTDVLVLSGNKEFLERELKELGVGIINLGLKNIYSPNALFQLRPYIYEYQIIHVHLFPSLYWIAIARMFMFTKTPKIIYTEHSTWNRRRKNVLWKYLDKFIYSSYDRIVAISTEVKLQLKKHLGVSSERIVTINNGISSDSFPLKGAIDKTRYGVKETEILLTQVARFTFQKDQETLIRAIPFIEHPIKVLLIGVGPKQSELMDLVHDLNLVEKVLFLGERSDVQDILCATDISVLSSNYEGLSLSGLEAMASGTPLVASKVPGLTTLVHGAGVLFEHKDHLDLAEKINELIENPEHYKKVAQACLERSKKYSLEKMVEAHIKLYTELCQSPN